MLKHFFSVLIFLGLVSCTNSIKYEEISVSERKVNLSGLVAVSTNYLNENPDDFYKFHHILVAADGALGSGSLLSRGGVMGWIDRTLKQEGFDETMPVYLFLKLVYLEGWEHSYMDWVDVSEREYLYDLISAVMGGMHLCTTCSTSPPKQ